MENLINTADFAKAANLKKFKISSLAEVLMKMLRLSQLNDMYRTAFSENPVLFLDKSIEQLGIRYHLNPDDLKNLPKEGAFITVSNHPYGGIDGLILLRILAEQREDYKVVANYLLRSIEPLKDKILPVNPFDQSISSESSFAGLRIAMKHLKDGHPLGFFPAGEVSSLHKTHITDKQWDKSAIKFIQKAQVPIVPIYFKGRNSVLFHLLGMINPLLRTAKLPSELLNKKDRTIEVRICKPIQLKEQQQFAETDQLGRYIRSKTYALGSAHEVKRFFRNGLKRSKVVEPIQEPQPKAALVSEIEILEKNYKLFDSANFSVYCTPSQRIPSLMQEIGRLRELTFREVGEGTNHSVDLDEYDLYYHHLIIWDKAANTIVGGYRIGKGADIMRAYGMRGFYTFQLFKIKAKLFPVMRQSLELGRSYIVKEYQKKPLPLFLLWKGILVFLLQNPEYRYLMGPVSISNKFSGFSKGILIEFLKRNFYHEEYAKHVKPRNKFKVDQQSVDVDILLESSQADLSKLDKIIQEIEPLGLNIPVLFKKYLKQNATVIGFNIDPKFNDALDGFMLLDVYDIPSTTIVSLMKEMDNAELSKAMFERNLVA